MPLPKFGQSESEYISEYMSSEEAQKSFPNKEQRLAVAYSEWRKHHKKETLFCNVSGYGNGTFESKEDDYVKGGYIATTHLDSGWYDDSRNVKVRDRIARETLELWAAEINAGNPRVNKVSVHHNREPHVAGVAVKGSARVDKLPDGEYGLWTDTLINATKDDYEMVKYQIDKGLIDSFSIEYDTGLLTNGKYYDNAANETQTEDYVMRELLPGTTLMGYTLASQPMNEHAIMLKEIIAPIQTIENKQPEIEVKEVSKVADTETKTISDADTALLAKYRELEAKEAKEKEINAIRESVMAEVKEKLTPAKVEEKVMKTPDKVETKEYVEYKEVFSNKNIPVVEQFKRAGRYAQSKGMFDSKSWETAAAEGKEYKFSTNGTMLEYKGLGVTTNQNSDTDYLLSAAELNDVFDPVIYNALNQATVTWNLLAKDDFSNKGNNQVQFTLKTVANATAGAYTGNAVTTGVVTRLKYQTKFKKYLVGVEVDGDMIAAARGGPIGDVFAQEVKDSTDDLLSVLNQALFPTTAYLATETCAETSADMISFESISDSAGNATLYNLTRSTTNKLSPASASDTYINGASADLSITNLRAAKRQAINEGAKLNNLVFIGNPIQGDKLRGIYDASQRLVPTSSRYGFEGMMTFDGIPFFEDKDCNTDDVWCIDLETHRIAVWVPPTLEMLGKDADAQKGFIKTYIAAYNRAPRRLVQIYGNATS